MKNRNMKKAFTLVEVLIVIVIIGILFIVLVSKVDFSVSEAKEMSVTTDFLAYQLAMEQVCIKEKQLPSDMNVLRDKLNKYLEYDLLVAVQDGQLICDREDPWGNHYQFDYNRSGGNLGKLTVTSAGGDKAFGTDDDLYTYVEYKNTPYGYKVIKGDHNSSPSELPNQGGGGSTPVTPAEPELPEKGLPLSSYSWSDIKAISEAGKGDEYFDVGDVFQVSSSMSVVIIDFGKDTISGTSQKAGITFAITTLYNNLSSYKMNSASQSNAGGWRDSELRDTLNNDIFTTLPIELQTAIKSVDKKCDTGNGTSAIVNSSDKLWLFSTEELGLGSDATMSGQGSIYQYFGTADNRIGKNSSGTAKTYWTRTANISSQQFRRIGTGGTAGNAASTQSSGIIFGFCI